MDLASNSFSDAFFGDNFNSNSSQMDDNNPGYLSLNRSCPLTTSMKTLVICNSRVYVRSDDEKDFHNERNGKKNIAIVSYNCTISSENRSRHDDKFTESPGTSKIQRTDSWRTTTIRTCSREVASRIPVYVGDNSQGTSKGRRSQTYTKDALGTSEPDIQSNDNISDGDCSDCEFDKCSDDSLSSAKSLQTFTKIIHVKDQNEASKQYMKSKYEEKKSKRMNSGGNTDGQQKEFAEKWTYCRPVLNLYNREVRFKYIDKVNKIQKIVRQIADARDREKQQEAKKSRIDELKRNTGTDISVAITSTAPDSETNRTTEPTERCKALLVDIFGPSMGIIKQQILGKDEGNNTDGLSDDDKTEITKRIKQKDASCYPMYLIRKPGTKPGNDNVRTEKRRSEGIQFEPYIPQTKLVSNKSMCFPTASLTLLHSGKSTKEKQKKITRDSKVNTDASLRYKFEFSNLNKQKSAEEVNRRSNVRNRKTISKHRYNINDDVDNIKTNLFIRKYLHDYQPHSGSNGRKKCPVAEKKPCCNSDTNTEISYHYNHEFSRNNITSPQRKELVSILKNKPYDGGVNTDKVMPDYEDDEYEYIILEPSISAPFDNETICFPTASNAYFSHSSNDSDSDHHFHGQKKYDKQTKRKRARKTKVVIRKKVVKPKTYSVTTQTERISSFDSVRRFVRYRDDPNGSPSRNTRGNDDKEEEERKSSTDNRRKFDSSKENSIKEEPESPETTDKSEPEKNDTQDGEYNKYSNSIAKRQSKDEDSLTNRRIDSKDGKAKSAESSPKANTSGISNKSKMEERKQSKQSSQQSYKNSSRQSSNEASKITSNNNTPPNGSTSRGSNETKDEKNMPKPKQSSKERNSSENSQQSNKSETKQTDQTGSPKKEESKQPLLEETDKKIDDDETARPLHEEFERISEDVARLKSRNEERNSSAHMKNLEDKLDLLIGAINHLVNQLQNKCKEIETEEEAFQPTCDFNECISRKPPVSDNTNTTDKRRSSQGNKRNSDTSDSIKQIYVDNNAGTSAGAGKTSTGKNMKGKYPKNNSRVVNTLYFDPEDNPMQSFVISTKKEEVETKNVSQMIQQTSNYRILYPNNNNQAKDVMYSMYNPKIEQILEEEMGKSDQAKKDIDDIINGDFQSQTLQTAVDVPTRERSTEVTDSLSKTKIIPINTKTLDEDILCSTLSSHGTFRVHKKGKDHREMVDASGTTKRCLTITLDTIPLGILGLLRVSTNTIGRILSFMQGSLPYSSLLPISQAPAQYVCNLCKAVFGRSSELTEHMQCQHRVPSVRDCCVCRHLLELQKARGRAGLFTCQHCGQVYTRAYCCELHQRTCARRLGRRPSVTESLSILR